LNFLLQSHFVSIICYQEPTIGDPMQKFDDILKQHIQEHLAPARIVDVKSEEAEDYYGDPILRIRVVYEAENNRLDPEKVVSLARHLYEPLKAYPPDCYPVISYMIPEEVEYATE